jgi:alginate O-acetyltransferase complex protein AlgI
MTGYAIQLYADFSGYSNMAIGAAKILGLTIPENFNFPYLAVNLSDFWRRWHMTMTSFFRDYVRTAITSVTRVCQHIGYP